MWVLRVCASDRLHLMARSVLGRLNRALVEIEDTARIYMLKRIVFMSILIKKENKRKKNVYTPL